jgi:hypothetical protein
VKAWLWCGIPEAELPAGGWELLRCIGQLKESVVPVLAESAVDERHLARLAVRAGLLKSGEPLPPELREFAGLVATHCGAVVDGYVKDGGDAGEALIAHFGLG